MDQLDPLDSAALLAELEQKDRLIEQLSEELMRYMHQPDLVAELPAVEMAAVPVQQSDRQPTVSGSDSDSDAALAELRVRNQELEALLQELPAIYQEKFADRFEPVKEQLRQLQHENQKLRAEVKSLHYRMAVRDSATPNSLTIPNFATPHDAGPISSFGNV